MASKFWEHFIYIAYAMSHRGHDGMALWNDRRIFYDRLKLPDGNSSLYDPFSGRSCSLSRSKPWNLNYFNKLPAFKRRMEWFIEQSPIRDRSILPAWKRR